MFTISSSCGTRSRCALNFLYSVDCKWFSRNGSRKGPFGGEDASFNGTGRKAKRRIEVYERISRYSQHEHNWGTPLGWISSSGVGRHFASRLGSRLERPESGPEARKIDTAHGEAGERSAGPEAAEGRRDQPANAERCE